MPNFLNRILREAVHEDGTTTLLGRMVRYDMDGYMYEWELHYKAEVVDVVSGLRAKAKNYLSRYTSLRYAFMDLLKQLVKQGIIDSLNVEQVARLAADCVEHPSRDRCVVEQTHIPSIPSSGQSEEAVDTSAPTLSPSTTPSGPAISLGSPSEPSSLPSTPELNGIPGFSPTSVAVGTAILCVVVVVLLQWYCKSKKSSCRPVHTHTSSQPTQGMSLDSAPTLEGLLRFPSVHGTVNIPEQIGRTYRGFGILLLRDSRGAVVDGITHRHLNDPEQISMEVLRRWLEGAGRRPKSWRTLTQCLRDVGKTTLAEDIEQSLIS